MSNIVNMNIARRLLILESMVSDIYDSVIKDKKICPVCNNEIRLYVPFGETIRRNAQCPVCRTLERHRALWLYIQNNTQILDENIKLRLLHFAPEQAFLERFSKCTNIDYYPVDIDDKRNDIRDIIDIQKINYPDEMFDIIICSHVLEHVPDDRSAMKELQRVMKKSGVAFFMVPIFKEFKDTFERPEYNTPELRTKYYGQCDHLRAYGVNFDEILEQAGFTVDKIENCKTFTDNELSFYGLLRDEEIFKCMKNVEIKP